MSKIKLTNGRIITTQRIISDATVLIVDNKISEIGAGDIECPDAQVIDVEGKYISPGFLDIHIHGGGDHDFMDGSVDAFLAIAETHAKYGTTAMVPTTLTSEKENLLNTLSLYEEANRINSKGSQFLGMHLEGPYFAMNQRGAQDPRYIRNPDPAEYKEVISKSSSISRWSAAPELPGSLEFGKYLRENGILAAIAHTDAVYEEVVDAVECGYSLATHLYSGMSGVTRRNAHRYAGVIESAFIIDSMDVEVIADGIHLPAPFLRLIYKIKGPDRIALITDAMRGAGMPPGESILGNKDSGLKVIIEEGVAKLPDRTAFAGSVATADRLVRNMIELADVPLVEAVKMMSITPARIVGVDSNKGSLMVGKDADIVVFDEKINIFMTMVNGNIVYKNLYSEELR